MGKFTLDEYERRVALIDPLRLHEAYIALPADLAHWNARLAEAFEAYLRADFERDKMEARLSLEGRHALAIEQGKVTEAQVRERVRLDPRWEEISLAAIEAEARKVRTRGIVDAILAKKEMLISLGAHVRKEMEHNPVLRDQHRDQHARSQHSNDDDDV